MRHIEEYVLEIQDEIESARNYGEKAIYNKYQSLANRYKNYLDMANDELRHAKILHDMAMEDINDLTSKGYNAPEEMQEMWQKSHTDYLEKVAWIKQILTL